MVVLHSSGSLGVFVLLVSNQYPVKLIICLCGGVAVWECGCCCVGVTLGNYSNHVGMLAPLTSFFKLMLKMLL